MAIKLSVVSGKIPSHVISYGGNNIKADADLAHLFLTPSYLATLPTAGTPIATYLSEVPSAMDEIAALNGGVAAESGVIQIS